MIGIGMTELGFIFITCFLGLLGACLAGEKGRSKLGQSPVQAETVARAGEGRLKSNV